MARRCAGLALVAVASLLLAGCDRGLTPTATPEPARATSPAISQAPTAVPVHTAAPSPTASASPTALPTATPTPEPTPSPLPAASLLAFETTREGKGEIYVLDTATGQIANLSRHPAEDAAPDWSPDGSAVAFASRRDGNWEIYVLSLDGGNLVRLTDHPAYDGAPAWSPDGKRLAFESYRDGNLEIYVLDVANREVLRLTDHPAGDLGPAWSPDGGTIAFTSWRDGNKEIYALPAAGGEARNLSQHPADDESPVWAPATEGASLAFVSWRDVDPQTGNRNAEIYLLPPDGGEAVRLTDDPWPDLDPAWDAAGRLIWSAYDPGPPFETYDPYRPGSYHLVRAGDDGPEDLAAWQPGRGDDRRPAPVPAGLARTGLPAELAAPAGGTSPALALEPGSLARVLPVPGVLTSYDGAPVLASELVSPSLLAWQRDVLDASGYDLLHGTLGTWRPIDSVRRREMYTYDYGYLSWHKTGRALDLALEYKVEGVDQMLVVRDDLGPCVYWRMFLRTARQDGSQGAPLTENPWLFWWHIVPESEPEAYDAGGKRLPIPAGYYVDVTAIARRHGWDRIASYAIEGDYHWLVDSNGTEYWHYERTDGLLWWEAMLQIYSLETLTQHAAWKVGLQKAQSEDMMRSKGVPNPAP